MLFTFLWKKICPDLMLFITNQFKKVKEFVYSFITVKHNEYQKPIFLDSVLKQHWMPLLFNTVRLLFDRWFESVEPRVSSWDPVKKMQCTKAIRLQCRLYKIFDLRLLQWRKNVCYSNWPSPKPSLINACQNLRSTEVSFHRKNQSRPRRVL